MTNTVQESQGVLLGRPLMTAVISGLFAFWGIEAQAEEVDVFGGMVLSEEVQVRVPAIEGVPISFSNVNSIGFIIQLGRVELSPRFRSIYSLTRANVTSGQEQTTTEAEGWGWEAALRIAVGWIDRSGGPYFFMQPGFSVWSLFGKLGQDTVDADITEFGTEFGFGYLLGATDKFRVDIFCSAVRVGVRPGESKVLFVTSYPTIGVAVEWLW